MIKRKARFQLDGCEYVIRKKKEFVLKNKTHKQDICSIKIDEDSCCSQKFSIKVGDNCKLAGKYRLDGNDG